MHSVGYSLLIAFVIEGLFNLDNDVKTVMIESNCAKIDNWINWNKEIAKPVITISVTQYFESMNSL